MIGWKLEYRYFFALDASGDLSSGKQRASEPHFITRLPEGLYGGMFIVR